MINKVILLGNVGQDPQVAFSQQGSKIVNFSLATNESWKDKSTGERKTITQWHRVVIFNENLADIAERYVKKGNQVYIEGALQHRKYTGNDGIEKNITEVVLTRFKGELTLLGGRSSDNSYDNSGYSNNQGYSGSNNQGYSGSNNQNNTSNKSSNQSDGVSLDDLDDEIPF